MRFYLVALFVFIMCAGCQPTKGLPPKFIADDFSADTAQIIPEHDFSFTSLKGAKIYIDVKFDDNGEFYVEDYSILKEKTVKIAFKESNALQTKVCDLFKENGVTIVNDKSKADKSICVVINKITSILEKLDYDWETFGFNLDNWAKMNWGIIMEARISIDNSEEKLFRRIIILNKDLKLKRTGTYAVVASHTNTELTTETNAHYVDGSPLAHTAIVQKQEFTAALLVFVSNDWAGNITLYNPRTGGLEKNFSFDTDKDWDGFWTGKITDEKKAKALDYYATPRGYFTILAYDLMEFIFEEVAKEVGDHDA